MRMCEPIHILHYCIVDTAHICVFGRKQQTGREFLLYRYIFLREIILR